MENLNEDILYYIFSLNGHADSCYIDTGNHDMYTKLKYMRGPTIEESALTITRHSSQVCREWRSILLSAPQIWATAIDLQCLDQPSDHWRKEVLRRTGDYCLFTIIGDLVEEQPSWNFFLSLLEKRWTRIRRLFVQICGGLKMEFEVYSALKKASPNLELLIVVDAWQRDTKLSDSADIPLFANYAPRLLGIECRYLRFDPTACSWASNLRHIWDINIDQFSPSRLFECLKRIPHLETLGLSSFWYSNVHNSLDSFARLSPVYLPSLRKLNIQGDVISLLPILHFLAPGANCLLKMKCFFSGNAAQDGVQAGQSVSEALTTFFRHCPPVNLNSLVYHLSGDYIHIGNNNYWVIVNKNNAIYSSAWDDLVCGLSRAFAGFISLSHTVDLTLDLFHKPECRACIFKLLNQFIWLRSLKTSLKTIQYLNESHAVKSSGYPIIFPSGLNRLDVFIDYAHCGNRMLHEFVIFRDFLGLPVKELRLVYPNKRRLRKATSTWKSLALDLNFKVKLEDITEIYRNRKSSRMEY